MRFFGLLLPIVASVILLSTAPAHGEDKPLLKALFGERADNQAKKKSSSKKRSTSAKPGFGRSFGGPKRVEIDLSEQKLRAYQGNRVVMSTRISSGRNGRTPTGSFRAGPYKAVNHYSSIYHNAHMPYSVQVSGHIFIHGFSSVPRYPASHGCIRVPISGNNPAKRFYNWVDVGTPIRIAY